MLTIAITLAAAAVVVDGPAAPTFDLDRDPRFSRPAEAVRAHVRRSAIPMPATVCVIGYGRTGRHAWIAWPDGRRLVLWEGADPEGPEDGIGVGRRDLDRNTDAVATDDDVHGSSYLVTRAWFDGIVRDCRARGVRVRLRR